VKTCDPNGVETQSPNVVEADGIYTLTDPNSRYFASREMFPNIDLQADYEF
jgi:hypothetical protein